ncbi:phage tail spike protein [Ligilactobacillus agilis]|nr:phage tail spike protein [Ligilactobacillus agilis]
MIEEINTANQLTFSVMTNSRIDTAIQYVCIPAPRGDAFLMFKLISETVKNDRVEYTAVESAYDELKAYSYIKDMRPSGKTAGQMLEQVIQGTRWSLGYIADTNQSSTSFYYITVLEAIQKIVELFNVELTFDVNIDKKTNVISSRRINLYTQQGERTGKRFEYGSNLLEVTREQSSENLITALIGRGKGEEVSQGEDGSPDGYGRRITFADIEWKKSNGNPADKPKGQEYVEDKNATALYGFSDGRPRIGLTTFEDITDPQELLKATWASLQIAKRPQVAFKASVLDVGDLGLGDTVAIIRHDLGIEYFTRVYKVEHDLLNRANNTIELGDDFSQKSLTNYVADVAKIAENVKNTAEYAVSSASGKNKNYYSKTKPQYANEGDNLFLDLGNGETELYAWHNGNWELVVSTADTTAVKRQVEQAQADLAQVRADANRISETQTESAKRLDEQMQELRAKTVDNATNVQNVIRDVAQAHADYVAQQADISKQKADLEKAKQSLQTTSQNLDQARQDLLSNSTRLDKLEVGVNGVSINVNNLNTKVDGIQIGGGKNLVHGTSADWQGVHTNEFNGNDNQTFLIGYAYLDQLSVGDSVTVSCHYQYSGVTASNAEAQIQGSGNVTGYDNGQLIRPELIALEQGTDLKFGTIKYTFKLNSQMVKNKYWEVRWRFNHVNQGAWFQWCFFKIEKGTTATPWSPAPEEEIKKVAQLKVDLDGIQGTVANNQGDITQIKLTENGMQQNIKDAQGNISSLQNDAKQFKQQFADVDGNIANLSASAKNFELQMQDAQGNISSLQNDAKQFKQQFADTNGNIATIKRNATELSEQLASKVGNTEYQSFKTQTAKELSQKLVRTDLNGYATTAEVKLTADGLNARFDNLNVGGTNMLYKTKDIDSTVWIQKGKAYYDTKLGEKAIHAWGDWSTYVSNQTIHLESNTDYTISASLLSYQEGAGRLDGSGIQFGVYAKNTADNQTFTIGVLQNTKGNLSNAEWKRFSTVYHNTTAKDITDFRIEASGDWSTVSGNVWIAKIKLEDGNVPTPWSPAFEDIDDKFEGLSSRISANSSEFSTVYTKITNAKNDAVNTIKNDSQWQSMGKIVTNASFLQNANGFAQEVVKTATPMIEGGGKNLARGTSDSWQGVSTQEFNGGIAFTKYVADVYLDDLNVGDKVTVQIIYQYSGVTSNNAQCWLQGSGNTTGWNGGNFYGTPTTINMQTGTDVKHGSIKYTFTLDSDMKKNRYWSVTYRFDNVNKGAWFQWLKFKVEKGTVATPWSPAPEDLATKLQLNQVIDTADSHTQIIKDYLTNDNSQFKLLKNAVNLKVEKGDVIGQINLEAGKTLIQNQKVYLDADTVVFSNKAFIPSAAITSLDAGKITTGTLNAAAVKVINIDASKITTGKLNGMAVKIDGKTSEIDMTTDRGVVFRQKNGSWATTITSKQIQFENNSSGQNEILGFIGGQYSDVSKSINGIRIVIPTQQQLGAPYGGDEFTIGYATDRNGHANSDFIYNASGQLRSKGFHWYESSHLYGKAQVLYIDGAHDPLWIRGVKFDKSSQNGYYQPTISAGWGGNTYGNSGISFLWDSILLYGSVQLGNIRVADATNAIGVGWTSWSDWNNEKYPSFTNENGSNHGGIAFPPNGNTVVWSGMTGQRQNTWK